MLHSLLRLLMACLVQHSFNPICPIPNVTWEQTKNGNIGLDGAFFNWRLNFSIDVYDRHTDGLLLKVPFPAYSGTTAGWSPGAMQAPYVNVGSMSNKGIDIRVGTTNISNKNFSWKTDITVSRNINKVLNLGAGDVMPALFRETQKL